MAPHACLAALAALALFSSVSAAETQLCGGGSCLAADEDQDGSSLSLLQVESAQKAKEIEPATLAASASPPAAVQDARAPAAVGDVGAIQVREAARSNSSLGGAARADSAGTCQKHTGGSCLMTSVCDDSRSAACVSGACVCPEFTCASEGKCSISATEIKNAVGSGATDVVSKVTASAAQIPGLADTAGHVQGVWNTVGGVVGSVFGNSEGSCSGYIGVCWGQCGNQEQLGYTAQCTYASCQCKAGFCAVDGVCRLDISGLVSGSVAGLTGSSMQR
mmetsp:Transcript_68493/g.179546  ORF Transcript_68493/g.179546 Transcript_68493/m.179546 type:complete len:277 (+) Transcript_68493:76-906(+)